MVMEISLQLNNFIKYTGILTLVLIMAGCQESRSPDRSIIPEKVTVHHYGRDLFSLDPVNIDVPLRAMSDEYSFFLGNEVDTLEILQIRDFIMDPMNRQLAEECTKTYPDLQFLENELGELFARCKAHLPGFSSPTVYTYVSGLLYEMPVQYVDSVLIIGLDMYLGRNYEPYRAVGIPMFLARRMERGNILPECARQITYSWLPDGFIPKTLLDHMILEGKTLYSLDILLPETEDTLKIGYTGSQMEWCAENEKNLWRMLIDQDLLFSSDPMALRKFIQDGPFTAGMPEGAPAMLGKWTGWQIVRSYMKKNTDLSLPDLLKNTDSQKILSDSGYKPKK